MLCCCFLHCDLPQALWTTWLTPHTSGVWEKSLEILPLLCLLHLTGFFTFNWADSTFFFYIWDLNRGSILWRTFAYFVISLISVFNNDGFQTWSSYNALMQYYFLVSNTVAWKNMSSVKIIFSHLYQFLF